MELAPVGRSLAVAKALPLGTEAAASLQEPVLNAQNASLQLLPKERIQLSESQAGASSSGIGHIVVGHLAHRRRASGRSSSGIWQVGVGHIAKWIKLTQDRDPNSNQMVHSRAYIHSPS